ncbi:MAG: cysteine hydrolase [Anaerolineales bacterium]|nr:cysteine hydrolase [Anaerolineales bacterium]
MTDNPSPTALLVIDVQQGLFKRSTPIYQAETLLQNIQTLITRAHQAGVPVIYVQHESDKVFPVGSEDWQLHPSLHPLEDELIIHKQHGSAFEETSLGEALQKLGTTHLVICGLVTHGCIKAGCQDALKQGYQVTLVSDAHSNYSKDAARFIDKWNTNLQSQGAALKTTQEIEF